MKIPYIKIYAADLLAASRNLTAEQLGDALLGICEQAFENHTLYEPQTPREKAFFQLLCGWKDEAKESYKAHKKIAKKAALGRWQKTKFSDGASSIPSRHTTPECQPETEPETNHTRNKPETENINIFTVPPALAQDIPDFSGGNSKALTDVKPSADKHLERAPLSKGTTPLHAFAREVLTHFEPSIDDTQQDIWFKRNCRCLKDILDFCHGDNTLALTTIDVCLEGAENAGFSCGYEAVARNITNYYTEAQKRVTPAKERNCNPSRGHVQGMGGSIATRGQGECDSYRVQEASYGR